MTLTQVLVLYALVTPIISMPVRSVYILAVVSVAVLVCCNGLSLFSPAGFVNNMAALEPVPVPTGPQTYPLNGSLSGQDTELFRKSTMMKQS